MPANSAQNGSILPAQAVEALTQTPEEYLKPSPSYNADWASLSKRYIDLLASSVSTTQSTRKNYVRKNRKRKHSDEEDEELQPLQIREIYLDGFTGRQVWEQVNKVLKASREEAGRDISLFNKDLEDAKEALRDENGEQGEGQDDSEAEGDEEAGEEEDFEGLSEGGDGEGQEEEEGFPEGEDDYVESEDEPEPSQLRSAKPKKAKADPHGLNDGFFSIDDFNAQSTMFERKDAKAEDDEDEDEEHIDWSADPNAQGGMEDLEDDEEDEDEEDEDVDMMGLGNANDIMYDDFFGPPDAVSKKGQDKGKRDEEPEEDQEMEDEEEKKEEAKPQE
ncbi:U3 snoRNP protein, partial [Ascosphaera atra]